MARRDRDGAADTSCGCDALLGAPDTARLATACGVVRVGVDDVRHGRGVSFLGYRIRRRPEGARTRHRWTIWPLSTSSLSRLDSAWLERRFVPREPAVRRRCGRRRVHLRQHDDPGRGEGAASPARNQTRRVRQSGAPPSAPQNDRSDTCATHHRRPSDVARMPSRLTLDVAACSWRSLRLRSGSRLVAAAVPVALRPVGVPWRASSRR